MQDLPTVQQIKKYAEDQLKQLRKDHKRDLNPTPYKVSLTDRLSKFMHDLLTENLPVGNLE